MDRLCCEDDCNEIHYAKGLCKKHYMASPQVKQQQKDYRKSLKGKEISKAKKKKYKETENGKGKGKESQKRWSTSEKGKSFFKAKSAKRRAKTLKIQVEKIKYNEIFERDLWVCNLCGKPVDKTKKYPDAMSASLDHIIPLSKGGSHTKDNVQLAHLLCNIKKGNK